MDFIHEVNRTIVLTEFILRIHENQSAFSSNFWPALEESKRIFFKKFVFLGSSQTLCQNFFLRDVSIVFTDFSLSCGGDNGCGELLIFLHAFGKTYATDFTNTALVSTPCRTAKITTNNHFNSKAFATNTYRYHGVGSSHFPVRTNVCSSVKELCSNLIQHLSLVRNTFGKHYVERRNSVTCYHHQLIAYAIYVANFTMIHCCLTREIKVCLC